MNSTSSQAVDAEASDVTGVDVSSFQHPSGAAIDWGAVAAAEDFAIVKATEGMTGNYDNEYFADDFDAAEANGMVVGSYHFADVGTPVRQDALGEAQHYFEVTEGRNGEGTLPPILDIEDAKGLSPAQLQTWVSTFLTETERLFGRTPIIYTYPSFWESNMATNDFAEYPLWIAHYDVSAPDIPGGWNDWVMWQYTSTAQVDGIPADTDRNYFAGTEAELRELAGGGSAPDPDPEARNGVCERGEFCLYYNSDNEGSVSDFNTSIEDYGDEQPTCYEFRGPGNGQYRCVKNDTASVWNRTGETVTVFYNSGYAGPRQSFAPGVRANLNATLKNENAAHRIG
ncbi:GH25 family lysozyme [Georgenia alba]|uniref:GH25 family lysozyme n=1 Tax=Georgenia alba TaxID=2233858 RepID=A0ABW2Q7R8_9MICO